LSDPFNALIVAGSLGIGLIPVVAPEFYAHFPESLRTILDSGISTGCIVALLLNLLFTTTRGGTRTALSASDTGEPATGSPNTGGTKAFLPRRCSRPAPARPAPPAMPRHAATRSA